jgi:hypothetical protein
MKLPGVAIAALFAGGTALGLYPRVAEGTLVEHEARSSTFFWMEWKGTFCGRKFLRRRSQLRRKTMTR